MPVALGPILTFVPSIPALRQACALMRADTLKVVTTHGLDGGWDAATIGEVMALFPRVVVRFRAGDPSYGDGRWGLPDPQQALDEGAAWYRAAPERVVFEIGNEPRQPAPGRAAPALDAYVRGLDETITACRTMFPRARLLAPAHSLHDPAQDDEVARWLAASASAYLRCDGVAIHAYNADQARRGLALVRRHVGAGLPVWLTEVNLGEPLPPAERGRRLWSLVRGLPIEAALVYHLDQSAAPATEAQGPAWYRLQPETLTALGLRDDGILGAAPADHWPSVRVDGFALDIRRWPTVADFRAHLARYAYRATAPWAKGVVIHHTYKPVAAEWRGWESVRGLAIFYRTQKQPAWGAGPHLFICPDAPREQDRGIWQCTPLNVPGIHAGNANAAHWGLEHVGDFTARPMPPDVAAMGAGVAAALLDWAGLPTSPQTVTPHSQWGKPTCPGAAVDMAAYRRAVAVLRAEAS